MVSVKFCPKCGTDNVHTDMTFITSSVCNECGEEGIFPEREPTEDRDENKESGKNIKKSRKKGVKK